MWKEIVNYPLNGFHIDYMLKCYSFGYIIALILWKYSFLEAKISIADFEVHLNISN